MSVHEHNENRVNQLISDSFQKDTSEFSPFLQKLKNNEIKETQDSEKRLINAIENSLNNLQDPSEITVPIASNTPIDNKALVAEALENNDLNRIAHLMNLQAKRPKVKPTFNLDSTIPFPTEDPTDIKLPSDSDNVDTVAYTAEKGHLKVKFNETITDLMKYDDLLPDNLGLFLESSRHGLRSKIEATDKINTVDYKLIAQKMLQKFPKKCDKLVV